MVIFVKLSDVIIRLVFPREIQINPEFSEFCPAAADKPDLTVRFSWDWANALRPQGEMSGQDRIQNYWIGHDMNFCETRGGWKGPVGSVVFDNNFKEMVCTVNAEPFIYEITELSGFFRMLPIRRILSHYGTLFFHASQIAVGENGILFTGASGSGKSTQAKLWEKHRGAEIICNDRALVRERGGCWRTYGFPIDGSEPVVSGKVKHLAAVILLRKSDHTTIRKLPLIEALGKLMPQMVMDGWDRNERNKILILLGNMVKNTPVYELCCTPTEEAVDILENELRNGGIILG